MTFYKLTDPLRSGDVIRAEGRKQYAYSFGPCRWVRTTVMMDYMNPDSPLYGKYEEIPAEEAQELLLAKSARLARLLPKARELAGKYHAGQTDKAGRPYIEHPQAVAEQLEDLEQKITAWLHDLCEDTPVTPKQLLEEGFTPRIVRAVELLTRPAGMDYYEYIRRLRVNPIARAVKIADLHHNMDLHRLPCVTEKDRARRKKYETALAFLEMRGDLPEKQLGPTSDFVTAMQVFQSVRKNALEGRKIPHGLSNPVLRQEEGQWYLAFFVYFYNKKNLEEKRMPRPVLWLLADIRTGEIRKRISCAEQDFSQEPEGQLYTVAFPDQPQTGAAQHAVLFEKLDQVRRGYLEQGTVDAGAYTDYLNQLLCLIPPAYRVFYRELSTL